ncbi:MAG: signal peptidase II [Methyloprofundus sp.]|nr:signal peptidase II [Methyloprofundus sp.]MDT8425162.1 signal peptidase II [Methyloprofundus sp.]
MMKWLWLSGLALILDQISKIWIDTSMSLYQSIPVFPGFSITYAHNYGAAFSFLSDAGGWQRWFFAALATGISIGLVIYLKNLKKDETLLAISLSLILGGALGNLIDRLIYGYVIDFFDVYYQAYHWPVFNIADSAITVGVAFMVYESFVKEKHE